MKKVSTQTYEPNSLLALGEKLRENPRTILLSIPVLGAGILIYSLIKDTPALAGAYGHLGLAFRLYYKHHWQNPLFLKIAHWLLSQSSKLGTEGGQPTVRMVMGSIAVDESNYEKAISDFEKGIRMARRIKDFPQAAFIESHLARIYILVNNLVEAKKHLDHSYKILAGFSKGKAEPRPHIWLTNAEIGFSEWYYAAGDKKNATFWAAKAERRVERYDLKTRRLDVGNLRKKIAAIAAIGALYIQKSFTILFNKI